MHTTEMGGTCRRTRPRGPKWFLGASGLALAVAILSPLSLSAGCIGDSSYTAKHFELMLVPTGPDQDPNVSRVQVVPKCEDAVKGVYYWSHLEPEGAESIQPVQGEYFAEVPLSSGLRDIVFQVVCEGFDRPFEDCFEICRGEATRARPKGQVLPSEAEAEDSPRPSLQPPEVVTVSNGPPKLHAIKLYGEVRYAKGNSGLLDGGVGAEVDLRLARNWILSLGLNRTEEPDTSSEEQSADVESFVASSSSGGGNRPSVVQDPREVRVIDLRAGYQIGSHRKARANFSLGPCFIDSDDEDGLGAVGGLRVEADVSHRVFVVTGLGARYEHENEDDQIQLNATFGLGWRF